MNKVPSIVLNNDVKIPQIGLGVWKARDGDEVISVVKYAVEIGYRLIDTAAIYGNEKGVGQAIKQSGVPRKDIFVTSKLWNSDQGYNSTLLAFEESLDRLGLDYLDMYLIHWPSHDHQKTQDTWRAFEELYKQNRIKAIGVSNFLPEHLGVLLESAEIIPFVDQIELHPYHTQNETREFCKKYSIAVESWSPLMHGGEILDLPIIKKIATKYDKTSAQVVLRWHIQNHLIVIPKSVTLSRIKENYEVFDFELSADEMDEISSLDKNKRIGPNPDSFGLRIHNSVTRITNTIKRKNQDR